MKKKTGSSRKSGASAKTLAPNTVSSKTAGGVKGGDTTPLASDPYKNVAIGLRKSGGNTP